MVGVSLYFLFPPNVDNALLFLVVIGAYILCSMLAYWVPGSVPVLGSVAAAALGYIAAFASVSYAKEYANIVWIALAVTVLVFLVMLFLYTSGIIKVNKKFKAIVFTLFIVSILGSAGVYISSLFTSVLTDFFVGDSTLALIVAIGALIIAALNLAIDFDYIATIVTKGMKKKYEWRAAYGLHITILVIFLRVLHVLSKFMKKK